MKQAAELAVADSGVLWTTLRATQFHDLMQLTLRAMAKLPVIPVLTGVRFQPVDSGEVADRLAGLMADLLASYLAARGLRCVVVPVRRPGMPPARSGPAPNLAPGPGRRPPDLGRLPGPPVVSHG